MYSGLRKYLPMDSRFRENDNTTYVTDHFVPTIKEKYQIRCLYIRSISVVNSPRSECMVALATAENRIAH